MAACDDKHLSRLYYYHYDIDFHIFTRYCEISWRTTISMMKETVVKT